MVIELKVEKTMRALRFYSKTIDVGRKEVYNNLSAIWWDVNGPLKSLHAGNKINVPFIQSHLSEALENKRKINPAAPPLKILDVGCGGGITAEKLCRAGNSVVGIDVAEQVVEVAKRHAKLDPNLKNLTYKVESVDRHASENYEKYDAVMANFVLQELKEHDLFLKSCVDCLKPGGLFFTGGLDKSFVGWLTTVFLAQYVIKFIPAKTHNYDNFISAADVEKILIKYGCEVKEKRGMYRKFFGSEFYWIKSTSSFFVLRAAKLG